MSLKTPPKVRKLQRKLYVKAKKEPRFRFYQLYDKVYREDILEHAYRLARQNGGAAGVDGVTFRDIERRGREKWMERLRKELKEKTYKPSPVRRVMIPKPGGGERPLGIPTVRDRVVQTAAKIVLEPIFEADFDPGAYGYRPKRSALGAVREVHKAICDGYTDVVDADLSKYFDTIPHRELMKSVARRVVDRQMLKLIKSWLKVPVEEGGKKKRMTGGKKNKAGTPQGGVISPLLANIYMHRYLRHWRQQGKGKQYQARVINYADDFVIVSRGHAAEALAWTRGVMERIGLTMNEQKTCLRDARRQTFDFLGYTLGPHRWKKTGGLYLAARPSKKAIARIKGGVRSELHPGNQRPWPEVAARLNRRLSGWQNYFSHGSRSTAYTGINRYVSNAVRHFLRRRCKVPTRGTRRYGFLQVYEELGVLKLVATRAARPSVGIT